MERLLRYFDRSGNHEWKRHLWDITKWIILLLLLIGLATTTLMLFDGVWGLGLWQESSDWTGASGYGPGPGQWRLKQLVITFIGGGALAFAGVLLQKVTKNNLAEVSILGIGSINIMFIFAYISFFHDRVFNGSAVQMLLPLVTIIASLIGTTFVWLIARSKRANKNTFVVVGIALQLLFEALSVIFINPSKIAQTSEGKKTWAIIKNYAMGNVETVSTPFWLIIAVGVIIGITITASLWIRKRIDIYETSPMLAMTLGIRIERLRFTIFVLVALLAGAEAAILGTVALLGIMAPSIARLLFRNKFISLAIASFIIGGMIVMAASIISINFNTQLPTGILATAITAPYFLFLIVRGK